MAKTKISEYDAISANNTDVDSINIAEGCAPSGINNAIREVMAHLKDFQTGVSGDSLTVGGTLTSGTVDINGGAIDGATVGATTPSTGSFTNLTASGTVSIPDNAISGDKVEGGTINAITINTLTAGQANFADNAKAIFGAGSDLQIYHSGAVSYIKEVGTGGLYVDVTNDMYIRRNDTSALMAEFNAGVAKLYFDNSLKLATTPTGIDVTGTATMDGLISSNVSGTTLIQAVGVDTNGFADVEIKSTGTSGASRLYFSDTAAKSGSIKYTHSSDAMLFSTAGVARLNIASNGDISFYEDTGTTAKFFWDASAESLGVGTSSPDAKIETSTTDSAVYSTSTAQGGVGGVLITNQLNNNNNISQITFRQRNVSTYDTSIGASGGSSNFLFFKTNGSERLRIDSAGNVGIGTGSPLSKLHINSNQTGVALTPVITLNWNETSARNNFLGLNDADELVIAADESNFGTDSNIQFRVDATERMRITSDGYLRMASGTGGIQFNGDTAAANALDDYEEGTWDLYFYDANTGGNQSPTTQSAQYTKIGDVVHIYLNTTVTNLDTTGMTAGNTLFFTLPFVPRTDNFCGSVIYDNFSMSGRTQLNPITTGGRGYFKATGTATGDYSITVGDITSGTTDIICLSMTYTTAS